MNRRDRLQRTLHTDIPITTAIGLQVASYDNGCLTLAAPLAPNINRQETAFAGSIAAVASLAGWSLLWCLLDEASLPGNIVIQDSIVQYLHPITTDITARCCVPEIAQVTRFLTILRRKSRARLELRVEAWEADTLAVAFTGRYVVQLRMT